MVLWGDLKRWDPSGLDQAEASLKRSLDELVAAGEDLEDATRGVAWQGATAGAAARRREQARSDLADLVAEVAAVRRGLADAADSARSLTRDVDAVEVFARSHEFAVTDAGTVIDRSTPREFGTEDEAAQYEADRRRLRDQIVADVEAALRLAAAIDADLTVVFVKAEADAVAAIGPDAQAAALRGELQGAVTWPPPPVDGSPRDNAAWWNGLSASQQQQILDDNPGLVANMDGVPGHVRDEANRVLIPILLDALHEEYAAVAAERRALPQTWTIPARNVAYAELSVRLGELAAKIASVEQVRALLEHDPDRQLLSLDITGERVTAAVGIGNVDTADHVAVMVPGFSTTVHDKLGEYEYDMRQLQDKVYLELDREGRYGEDVATVAWLGYEAPQWSEVFDPMDSVATPLSAERGADRLAPFLQGLTSSRADDPNLTVLGHSYGSVVGGRALDEETGADNYIAYGSPGIGRPSALQVDEVYVAEARNDPVADAAAFGIDPSLTRATQLSTQEAIVEGQVLSEITGHSSYLKPETTSQHNIALVVGGMEDDIIEHQQIGIGDVARAFVPFVPWPGVLSAGP